MAAQDTAAPSITRSKVEGEVDSLASKIERTEELVEILETRLQTIMSHDPPSGEDQNKDVIAGFSPMFSSLENMAKRLRIANEKISVLIDRLEI